MISCYYHSIGEVVCYLILAQSLLNKMAYPPPQGMFVSQVFNGKYRIILVVKGVVIINGV